MLLRWSGCAHFSCWLLFQCFTVNTLNNTWMVGEWRSPPFLRRQGWYPSSKGISDILFLSHVTKRPLPPIAFGDTVFELEVVAWFLPWQQEVEYPSTGCVSTNYSKLHLCPGRSFVGRGCGCVSFGRLRVKPSCQVRYCSGRDTSRA